MKANITISRVCIGIAIVAFVLMNFIDQSSYKLLYDTSLAIFGSALLASIVAYLAYINQLREVKIDLFTELLSGYRSYANLIAHFSGGVFDIDKVHSEAYNSLDRFFNKYSLYTALFGGSMGLLDQLQEPAKVLNRLNGNAIF